MKKFLYFGLGVCACCALCFCASFTSSVKAEETVTSINSATEFFKLFEESTSQKFVLTGDIDLSTATENVKLNNRNIQNLEFDGCGHSIVTSYPLFNIIGESAVIKNLNVIASKNFSYVVEASSVANFGLVACDVQGGNVFNVSASCEIAPKNVADENKYSMDLTFNGSANVGGLFGQLRYGAVVQNCYIQTKLNVLQNDQNATSTIVGGFVGNVQNTKITNCYVVPIDTDLVVLTNNKFSSQIIVGGFAGQLSGNIQCVTNVFAGGYLPDGDEQKSRYVGKVFGKVDEGITNTKYVLKISKCYTFNARESLEFCGIKSPSSNIDVLQISEDNLKSISTFNAGAKIGENYVWDLDYEWDMSQTWCKKVEVAQELSFGDWSAFEKWKNRSFAFPVLQVFESFSISINNLNNSVGVSATLVDADGKLLEGESFLYGTKVFIKIDITEDYLPYKVIDALKFKNVTCQLEESITDKQSATVPVVICEGTSGSYYVTTKNIPYYLKVVSQDNGKGTVRFTGATSPISQDYLTVIGLNSSFSYTANPASTSYAFEKWVWLDENGSECGDVYTGEVSGYTDGNFLAQQTMKILFGDSNYTDKDSVHLFLGMEDGIVVANDGIKYKIEDGKKIFTIQAKFQTNPKTLKVYVNAPSDACQVYIGENECESVVDEGMVFSLNITAAMYVKVRVEISDEYKFVKWSSLTDKYNITDLIDKKNCDTTSTEIYVKIQEPVMLFAEVQKIEAKKVDLTWLWWTLGGIGGAGLITLIVCLAVAKRKNENFVGYY